MSGTNVMVRVENLKVWYPRRPSLLPVWRRQFFVKAVDGVDFTVNSGEIYCIVGESGCGKTTLARTVAGMMEPEYVISGKVLLRVPDNIREAIEKENPNAIEDGMVNPYAVRGRAWMLLRRAVQMIFQDPYGSVNPAKTVEETLMEPIKVHYPDMSYSDARKMIIEVLDKVGLGEEILNLRPYELSGGMLQRVVIARSLLLRPTVLVLDEPVTMIDVSARAEVVNVMMDLKKEGIAQIMVTHDIALAKNVCDRIAVMYLGIFVEEAPALRIVQRPLHPYTVALISSVPEPDPRNRTRMRTIPVRGMIESVEVPEKGCRFKPRCLTYEQNPAIRPRCDSAEPPLVEVEPGHKVRCWMYFRG